MPPARRHRPPFRLRLALVLASVLVLAVAPAVARMYQWTSPATGTQQMSGEPPSWYRSGQPGPRVLVFQDGFLVDDTGIEVSTVRRLALRQQAFDELERRRTLEALRRVQEGQPGAAPAEEAVAEAPGAAGSALQVVQDAARGAARAVGERVSEALPEVLDPASIERLKQIIAEFDRRDDSVR